MYAIIETGGKQYKVKSGDSIYVEKLDAQDGSIIDLKVVALSKDGSLTVGAPYVEDANVTGKVVKSGKAKKITVFTYKRKKSSKRKMGHRQPYTKIEIQSF